MAVAWPGLVGGGKDTSTVESSYDDGNHPSPTAVVRPGELQLQPESDTDKLPAASIHQGDAAWITAMAILAGCALLKRPRFVILRRSSTSTI